MSVIFTYSQTEGKKSNIRALLCSLHTVLWDDAKWHKCEMHQLISAADVKKAYRKACLAVHPDKVITTEFTSQISKHANHCIFFLYFFVCCCSKWALKMK